MRVVVFSTYTDDRIRAWTDAIRRVRAVSDVLTIGPRDAEFLAKGASTGVSKSGALLARIRAWQPDCGVAIAAPRLPSVVSSTPPFGCLEVRIGEGAGEPPGLRELASELDDAEVAVHWLGIDRRGVGARGRVPLYPDDSLADARERMEELGRLLLCEALARVATGGAPGTVHVPPLPPMRKPSWLREMSWRRRIAWRRARLRWTPFVVAKNAIVAGWLAFVRPLRDFVRTVVGRHPVRIFTLHRVTSLCRDGMTVPPEVFARQMWYIRRQHDVVPLDKAISLVASGARLRRPVAAVTFDDGYDSVATEAKPVLDALGIPGACFVCPEVVHADGRYEHDLDSPVRDWMYVMDWNSIRALRQAGWHIGSHTANHRRVSHLDEDGLMNEVCASQTALKELVAPDPMAFAYPFGGPADVTPEAVQVARKCGYTAVLADYGGENVPGKSDDFFLRRIDIGGAHAPLMWKAMVHGLDFGFWRRARSSVA